MSSEAPYSSLPLLVAGQVSSVTLRNAASYTISIMIPFRFSLCAFQSVYQCLRVLAHSSLLLQLKIYFKSPRNHAGHYRRGHKIAGRVYLVFVKFQNPIKNISKQYSALQIEVTGYMVGSTMSGRLVSVPKMYGKHRKLIKTKFFSVKLSHFINNYIF